MASFDIKLTPASQRLVNRLAKAGQIDLRPTLNVIGIGYRKEVDLIFGKKQARGEGDRWAPLSEKYAKWKSIHYPSAPILVRTGALKKSMINKGSTGNITAISKTSAIFGSSISYAIYHDEGAKRLPRRNFSEPSERRLQLWKNQLSDNIVHDLERQGIEVTEGVLQ